MGRPLSLREGIHSRAIFLLRLLLTCLLLAPPVLPLPSLFLPTSQFLKRQYPENISSTLKALMEVFLQIRRERRRFDKQLVLVLAFQVQGPESPLSPGQIGMAGHLRSREGKTPSTTSPCPQVLLPGLLAHPPPCPQQPSLVFEAGTSFPHIP